MTSTVKEADNLGEGSELNIGNWLVEVSGVLARDEYDSGRVFLDVGGQVIGTVAPAPVKAAKKPFKRVAVAAKMSRNGLSRTSPVKSSLLASQSSSSSSSSMSSLSSAQPWMHSRHDAYAVNAIVLNKRRIDPAAWNGGTVLPSSSTATPPLPPSAAAALEQPVVVDPHLARQ
jgi:hypothetical protein